MGHGVHQIDLLAHLLGDWSEITATAARLDRNVETEDVSFAHIAFENGAIASVVNSVLSPREESYLRFDFTEATVELTHLYGYTTDSWRYTPLPGVEPVAWPPPGKDVRSAHAAQIPPVLDQLIAGEQPDPALPTVRRTMEIITAIYASAFTDKRVRREDLVPGHPFYDRLSGELETVS
jgi:predicted dehydrogenase